MIRAIHTALVAACALALAPAAASAALITFGSDLAAPADTSIPRQADTIFFQTAFPDGRGTTVPASGQITKVAIKGYAPFAQVPGKPGGETMFHVQTLKPLPDGSYQVLVTSGDLFVPNVGGPETITTYLPVNLCAAAGDVVVFNTIGGWDGTGDPPFGLGTPLQIFSRGVNATVAEYTEDNGTNNGAIVRPTPNPGNELLMQMTVGTGPDGTGLCPGGTFTGAPPPPPPPPAPPPGPPPPPPPPPPTVQKATIPVQRVTVSRAGKLTVSVFCRTGPSRCVGTVRPKSRARTPTTLGSGTFSVAAGKTGRSAVRLNKTGRKRFAAGGGRLAVNLVAETRPGGPSRRSTRAVTLRRRG